VKTNPTGRLLCCRRPRRGSARSTTPRPGSGVPSSAHTPWNVVRYGLADPFPNHNPGRKRRDEKYSEDEDDADDGWSSDSDDETKVLEPGPGEVVCPGVACQLLYTGTFVGPSTGGTGSGT
jgi:hypothetical protein